MRAILFSLVFHFISSQAFATNSWPIDWPETSEYIKSCAIQLADLATFGSYSQKRAQVSFNQYFKMLPDDGLKIKIAEYPSELCPKCEAVSKEKLSSLRGETAGFIFLNATQISSEFMFFYEQFFRILKPGGSVIVFFDTIPVSMHSVTSAARLKGFDIGRLPLGTFTKEAIVLFKPELPEL